MVIVIMWIHSTNPTPVTPKGHTLTLSKVDYKEVKKLPLTPLTRLKLFPSLLFQHVPSC